METADTIIEIEIIIIIETAEMTEIIIIEVHTIVMTETGVTEMTGIAATTNIATDTTGTTVSATAMEGNVTGVKTS